MDEERTENRASEEHAGPQLSRRTFLRIGAAGAGAVVLGSVLGACKSAYVPSVAPITAATPGATTVPATAAAASAAASASAAATSATGPALNAAGFPDLVIASDGEPEALVRAAIAGIGGMGRFVKKGQTVIVKPNICISDRSYEYAATTNPWVVSAVVKMALEAGASSVTVFDNPFSGDAERAYETSGIAEQVKAAGGKMVLMSQRGYVTKTLANSKFLESVDLYEDILKADVVINVPLVKDHSLSRMTAGMKNMMGLVSYPAAMHIDLESTIPIVYALIKPDLTVVDCVRVLTRGGPEGGDLEWVKKVDKVIASTDGVAADTYVSRFLNVKVDELTYLAYAQGLGLGQTDLSKVAIKEVTA